MSIFRVLSTRHSNSATAIWFGRFRALRCIWFDTMNQVKQIARDVIRIPVKMLIRQRASNEIEKVQALSAVAQR